MSTEPLTVKPGSESAAIADVICNTLEHSDEIVLYALGSGAAGKAVKSIATAQGRLKSDLATTIRFTETDGANGYAVLFHVCILED